jgi:hypothetical protein
MVRTSERIPLELRTAKRAKESKDRRQLEVPRVLGRRELAMAKKVKMVKMVKKVKIVKMVKIAKMARDSLGVMAKHRLSLSPNLSLRVNALIDQCFDNSLDNSHINLKYYIN